MSSPLRRYLVTGCWTLIVGGLPGIARAQFINVPLSADAWTATDTIRFEPYLGRPSLYIGSGVALAKNVALEDGTIEYDLAVTPASSFVGVAFRAQNPRFSEVIFFRPRSSGTLEAVQYGPAFNNVGVAWQVYHGAGANAVAVIPRERWMHVKVELEGPVARMYFDTATTPTLTVPRLAGSGGRSIGVWTGAFGRGAYVSNVRYAPAAREAGAGGAPSLPPGAVVNWELSQAIPAADFSPTRLPDLSGLKWETVSPEAAGFVLVNRYRAQPNGGLPVDPKTGEVNVDSVMSGKIAGSQIVYARTRVDAERDGLRRMHFTYSDGLVIYANGQPLLFSMRPQGLRDGLGVMDHVGDAVYLPLKRGRNEIVFAVIEVGGGWAFSGRLDPQ